MAHHVLAPSLRIRSAPRLVPGLIGALLTLGCVSEVAPLRAEVEQVIVVGAGVSGLSAARSLDRAGIPVIVLEARDRIGGRTSTVDVGPARIDEGGAWVHGVVDNPLARYLDVRDLAYVPHDYDFGFGWEEGVGPITASELDRVEERGVRMYRDKDSLLSALGSSASLAEGIDLFIEREGYEEADARRTRAMLRGAAELDTSGPAEVMDFGHWYEEAGFAGGDHLPVGGYVGLVDALAEGLDIRLDSEVVSIAYDDDGVRVETRAGAVFSGSQVVVTVPLGVLKAGAIAFDPPLPDTKLDAIDRLQMGNLEKVVMVFDQVFWRDAFGRDEMLVYSASIDGQNPAFFDFTDDAGAPTLIALYGGGYSRMMQSMDPATADPILLGDAMDALAESLERSIPTPVATHITHWMRDPYSLGSYSFIPIGASPADYERMASPVADRVLFAGEATYYAYFATVHGAMLSGLREAARLGGAGLEGL